MKVLSEKIQLTIDAYNKNDMVSHQEIALIAGTSAINALVMLKWVKGGMVGNCFHRQNRKKMKKESYEKKPKIQAIQTTVTLHCLRCGSKFESEDKVYNRLCKRCSVVVEANDGYFN